MQWQAPQPVQGSLPILATLGKALHQLKLDVLVQKRFEPAKIILEFACHGLDSAALVALLRRVGCRRNR